MKTCKGCVYAEWKRTSAGALHPSGEGRCTFAYAVPELPASMYWPVEARVGGGWINRREELPRHCAYWQRDGSAK